MIVPVLRSVLIAIVAAGACAMVLRKPRRASGADDARPQYRSERAGGWLGLVVASAFAIGGKVDARTLGLVAIGLVLSGLGLRLGPGLAVTPLRLGLETLAAAGVVSLLGVESGLTGTAVTDALISVGVVVVFQEAVRLLDAPHGVVPAMLAPATAALAYIATTWGGMRSQARPRP